jgi:hypothetical protein
MIRLTTRGKLALVFWAELFPSLGGPPVEAWEEVAARSQRFRAVLVWVGALVIRRAYSAAFSPHFGLVMVCIWPELKLIVLAHVPPIPTHIDYMVFGLIILTIAAVYGVLSALIPERMLRERINRRSALSFEEIYRTNFQQLPYPRGLIEDVWNELAYDLGLDASKIRPTDRFGIELAVKCFPFVDLNEAVDARLRERLLRNKASPDELAKTSRINTLFDYVEFACRIEKRGQPIV